MFALLLVPIISFFVTVVALYLGGRVAALSKIGKDGNPKKFGFGEALISVIIAQIIVGALGGILKGWIGILASVVLFVLASLPFVRTYKPTTKQLLTVIAFIIAGVAIAFAITLLSYKSIGL